MGNKEKDVNGDIRTSNFFFPVEELFLQLNNVIHVKTENLHGNICWKHFILEKENLQKFLRKMKYFSWFGESFF